MSYCDDCLYCKECAEDSISFCGHKVEKSIVTNALKKIRQKIKQRRDDHNVVTFNNESWKRYKNKIEAFDEVLKLIDNEIKQI